MLAQYDIAMRALSTALNSREVAVVLKSRENLEFIKLRARQLNDRKLLADATEFHMRVERWLGVLLIDERKAGHLKGKGQPRKTDDATSRQVLLREIGVSAALSMKATRAAKLNEPAFEAIVSEMRARISAGKAKLVSAIVDAEQVAVRSARKKRKNTGFNYLLGDGTPIGVVKLGKLRSRIRALMIELQILQAISEHVGTGAGALVSVEDSISEAMIVEIIRAAAAPH
jgi:hypothetical protein